MEKTTVKLGEVSKFINGDRGKNYPSQKDIVDDGEIPFINAGHLIDNQVNMKDMNYISREKFDKLSSGKVAHGDILYCLRGSLGKKALVQGIENGAIASSLVIIRPDTGKVSSEYLSLALESSSIRSQMTRANNGSSQPNLSAKSVREYGITLHSVEEQTEVVEKINTVKKIIDSRKEQLELLDTLIKSRFVEIFGDPVSNSMNWKQNSLKKVSSKIGSGATPRGGKQAYKSEGISLIRSMNVHNDRFVYKDLAFIDDDQAGKLDNVTIELNDVLLNITGASVARCCVVPEGILPARVNQHVSILRCKQGVDSVFLNQQLTNESYQKYLWNIATSNGATREAITKQQVEKLNIIIPPIDVQQKYSEFVRHVDKLKTEVQKSLEETQVLFDSLMQEYFE